MHIEMKKKLPYSMSSVGLNNLEDKHGYYEIIFTEKISSSRRQGSIFLKPLKKKSLSKTTSWFLSSQQEEYII